MLKGTFFANILNKITAYYMNSVWNTVVCSQQTPTALKTKSLECESNNFKRFLVTLGLSHSGSLDSAAALVPVAPFPPDG